MKKTLPLLIVSLTFVYTVLSSSNVDAQTHTYQDSTFLYLDNGTLKVGLNTRCGGAIEKVILNGTNYVNGFDCGRQIQVSFYDGNDTYDTCAGCTGMWGWNPVQGGDRHGSGSRILSTVLGSDFIYVKLQPNEWLPDNKGGGPTQPVPSDLIVEQTVSFLPGLLNALKLHYKITHIGNDLHANKLQEFPAVYVNLGFDRFVYYGGNSPWTGDQVSSLTMPILGQASQQTYYSPERWGAFVNQMDSGLTVFVPAQYPYVTGIHVEGTHGPYGSGANYFSPFTFFTWQPGSVLQSDIYIVPGDYKQARQIIYSLKDSLGLPDVFPPFGFIDVPANGQLVNVPFSVVGWAMDDNKVSKIEVLLDGTPIGQAAYGYPRPDVRQQYRNAPVNVGYRFVVQQSISVGTHNIGIRATDDSGNVAIFRQTQVVVESPSGIGENPKGNPGAFSLSQNYPNPFNPSTVIEYSLPKASRVVLKVYGILGREVRTLVNEQKQPGTYKVVLDASALPSGVYFYRITAGSFSDVKNSWC